MLYKGAPHFEEAVVAMAASTRSLQERLVDAVLNLHVCHLPGYLPPDMVPDFQAFWNRCTAVDPSKLDIPGAVGGAVPATVGTMTDTEAVAVAKDIVRFHRWLTDLWIQGLQRGEGD